jgi:N-acetyltransferase
MEIKPITLSGSYIRLEPLSLEHVPDLTAVGCDDRIWEFMVYRWVRSEEEMRNWVHEMLARQSRGTDLPFAVIHSGSGRAVGATRYMEIEPSHRRLEIGGTWYGSEYQRTVVNTECKYLLLAYAFEHLGCIRVQLKTDARNERSQKAIERLGAVKEGVLRNHMITPQGVIRHSVYYSIIDSEWPAVKKGLAKKLARE